MMANGERDKKAKEKGKYPITHSSLYMGFTKPQ